MIKLIKDDIIGNLQKGGGISYYWAEIYRNLEAEFEVTAVTDTVWRRYYHIKDSLEMPHIVHSSYYRVSKNKNAQNITTVHDFVYEYFAKGFRQKLHSYQKQHAIRHSSGVICISENTKKDLLKIYPDFSDKDITVIYNGFNTLDVPEKKVHGLSSQEEFYLFVGSRANYKNFLFYLRILRNKYFL